MFRSESCQFLQYLGRKQELNIGEFCRNKCYNNSIIVRESTKSSIHSKQPASFYDYI